MRAAPHQSSSYLDSRESIRSRAVSLLFALALTAGIIALLIGLGALPVGKKPSQPAIVMMQLPGAGSQPTPKPSTAKLAHATRGGGCDAPKPTPTKPPPTPPNPTVPVPWNVIPMSSSEFASSDIASKPSHRGEARTAMADGDGGDDSGPGNGTGTGPGGAAGGDQLLSVDWYRKPTDAELAPYMPRVLPANGGWGEIACRMIANYHVEDCRELGETPGSGFSRMMRQAAWQFLVLPPRRNGKQQLGSWVRIRYTFDRIGAPDPN